LLFVQGVTERAPKAIVVLDLKIYARARDIANTENTDINDNSTFLNRWMQVAEDYKKNEK
jgi:hypothetical protein